MKKLLSILTIALAFLAVSCTDQNANLSPTAPSIEQSPKTHFVTLETGAKMEVYENGRPVFVTDYELANGHPENVTITRPDSKSGRSQGAIDGAWMIDNSTVSPYTGIQYSNRLRSEISSISPSSLTPPAFPTWRRLSGEIFSNSGYSGVSCNVSQGSGNFSAYGSVAQSYLGSISMGIKYLYYNQVPFTNNVFLYYWVIGSTKYYYYYTADVVYTFSGVGSGTIFNGGWFCQLQKSTDSGSTWTAVSNNTTTLAVGGGCTTRPFNISSSGSARQYQPATITVSPISGTPASGTVNASYSIIGGDYSCQVFLNGNTSVSCGTPNATLSLGCYTAPTTSTTVRVTLNSVTNNSVGSTSYVDVTINP